jgi:hypothetical protein
MKFGVAKQEIPSAAKGLFHRSRYGTAEAVPLQSGPTVLSRVRREGVALAW